MSTRADRRSNASLFLAAAAVATVLVGSFGAIPASNGALHTSPIVPLTGFLSIIVVVGVLPFSIVRRFRQALALPLPDVELDPRAERFVDEAAVSGVHLCVVDDNEDRDTCGDDVRCNLVVQAAVPAVATPPRSVLLVHGQLRRGRPVLVVAAPDAARAIAALLLHIRDRTGDLPRAHFAWREAHPAVALLRWLVLGTGPLAEVTRGVIRRAEPRAGHRPPVHVS